MLLSFFTVDFCDKNGLMVGQKSCDLLWPSTTPFLKMNRNGFPFGFCFNVSPFCEVFSVFAGFIIVVLVSKLPCFLYNFSIVRIHIWGWFGIWNFLFQRGLFIKDLSQ